MKVTLDISQLLAEGQITQEEYDKLLRLSSATTSSLGFNILIAFGVVAISGGLLALFPSPLTAIVLGLLAGSAGLSLGILRAEAWKILGIASTLVGALLLGGGVLALYSGSPESFLVVSVIFAAAGVMARSGLLTALAVLSLSSTLGARTDYAHATYFLGIENPSLTILLFSVLALLCYFLSLRLSHEFERLAIIASRTSVFLVNFGFWIGSLWGDGRRNELISIPPVVFTCGWAIALLALGIWGAQQNRRWAVNLAAVFGAIHFYTQWFEWIGASPATIVIAGGLAIAGAVALRSYNVHLIGKSKTA